MSIIKMIKELSPLGADLYYAIYVDGRFKDGSHYLEVAERKYLEVKGHIEAKAVFKPEIMKEEEINIQPKETDFNVKNQA